MSAISSRLPAGRHRRRLARLGIVNGALAAALAGAGIAAYLAVGTSTKTSTITRTATAGRGVVLSTISATGQLQPAAQIGVDFTTGGQIVSVNVKTGQHVAKGQVLGRIDPTTANQSVQQAEASLATAQANYQQTLTGETASERRSDALSITQAKQALANAQRTAALDAQASAATIAQAKRQLGIDKGQLQVDLYQRTQDQAVYPTIAAAQAAVDADNAKLAADKAQQQADTQRQYDLQHQQTVDKQNLSAAQTAKNDSLTATYQNAVNNDQTALDAISKQLNADSYAISQDQSKLTTDQGYLSALQADEKTIRADEQKILADNQAIASAQRNADSTKTRDQQSIASSKLALQTTQASVKTKQAPPTTAALASGRASVVQAQIALDNARTALTAATLRAPIAGLVAAVNGSVGTQTAGGGNSVISSSTSSSTSGTGGGSSPFVTLTQLSGMQVLASFSETDAAKLRVGQPATVTVDALPNKELAAHVLAIASTATTSSGVVTYDVTFALDRTNSKLKPGMTANVDVIVGEADNVVHVPTAAVRGSGRTATVQVMRNGTEQTVPVVVGLQGDSATAILSGLKAGDEVVLPTVSISSSSSGVGGTSTSGATRTGGGGARFFGGGFGG